MNEFEKVVDEVQDDVSHVPSANESSHEGNDELSQLESLARLDPSILQDEEYQEALERVRGGAKKQLINQEQDEEEDEEEDEDGEDEEVESLNPFTSEKGKRKQKEIPIDFEIPEQFTGLIKDNFGVNDVPTFLNSVQTWRNQAQEANQLREYQEALEADLQALPYELKIQIDAWSKGENPLDVVKNITRLDFGVDFSNQKVETLVQHYLPEEYDELIKEFNNDSITEEELDKQIALLGRTTKRFFDKDKQAVKDQRDDYANRIVEQQKLFKNSALVSVENFSKAYPDFSKTEINKIRSTLVEGKLESIFFNPDGTYTEKAAEFVAFALNGKKILEDMENKGVRKGTSQASLDIVDKSPKSIKKRSQSNVDQKPDLSSVSHLSGMFKSDPYS